VTFRRRDRQHTDARAFAQATINPISKTNWEGTGVAPDVAVPAAQAFDKAYETALDTLAARTPDPQVKAGPTRTAR
jgi:hypothetical protein